jgi:hypothetical protein
MIKLLYKPLSLVFGLAGGLLASAIFNKVWGMVSDEPEAPDPDQEQASWGRVLAAAALQGAILSTTRAAVARGSATAVRRGTGVWPGKR